MECTERYLITRVWTFYHSQSDHARVLTICPAYHKLTRSTALERKRFDIRSLSPALHNLWLLLVIYISIPFLRLGVAIIYTSQSIKPLLRAVDSPMKPHYGVSSSPTIPCKDLNLAQVVQMNQLYHLLHLICTYAQRLVLVF